MKIFSWLIVAAVSAGVSYWYYNNSEDYDPNKDNGAGKAKGGWVKRKDFVKAKK